MRAICVVVLATLVAAPVEAGGFSAGGFASGFAQGLANGANLRSRRLEAERQRLCNQALDRYLNAGGSPPPPMCTGQTASVADIPSSAVVVPAAPRPTTPEFTNCSADISGGSHCTTLTPGAPIRFTNCTTDISGGKHCITQ